MLTDRFCKKCTAIMPHKTADYYVGVSPYYCVRCKTENGRPYKTPEYLLKEENHELKKEILRLEAERDAMQECITDISVDHRDHLTADDIDYLISGCADKVKKIRGVE